MKNFGLFIAVAISFLLVHFIKSAGPDFKGVFDFTDSSKAIRLTTVNSEISEGGLQFQVSNRSNFGYSDLELECDYIGNSGSIIKTVEVILYESFDHGSSSDLALFTLEIPEQSSGISCKPVDLKLTSELTCYVSAKSDSANKVKCVENEI